MSILPPSIQTVLDVFQSSLAEQRFGDVDAAALSRLAAEVESTAAELDLEERRLADLRQVLADRQNLLFTHAVRALAYARVYAEDDPELLERLNAIALTRSPKRPRSTTPPARSASNHDSAHEQRAHRDERDAASGDPLPLAGARSADTSRVHSATEPPSVETTPRRSGKRRYDHLDKSDDVAREDVERAGAAVA